mmetsp:Transcript_21990/g.65951  ORF Transcript_21990/g.65951 Transcript_21990/m.65951 type:complete len:523 (+) Transcript_21990:44-1612(+)
MLQCLVVVRVLYAVLLAALALHAVALAALAAAAALAALGAPAAPAAAALSFAVVAHGPQRPRVVVAAEAAAVRGRELVRLEALGGRHARELRQPEAHVLAVRVVVARLLEDVEAVDAAAREARGRMPVAPVGLGRVVHEVLLEVLGAEAPVEAQVVHEVGRRVLAAPVRHEARRRQFAHVRVDEGRARPARLPGRERRGVDAPLGPLAGPEHAVAVEERLAVAPRVEGEEVAPRELELDPVRGLVGDPLPLVARALARHAPRAHAAAREPGRQLRRVALADHAVARVEVVLEAVLAPDVALEAREGRRLAAAGREEVAASIDHGVGLGVAQVRQGRERLREPGGGRGRRRRQRGPRREAVAAHGRLGLLHLGAPGRELVAVVRLVEVVAVVERALPDAREAPEGARDLGLGRELLGAGALGADDRGAPELVAQGLEDVRGPPAPHDEAGPLRGQRRAQVGAALQDELGAFRARLEARARGALRASGVDAVVHAKDRHGVGAPARGRREQRVVVHAQLVAQPH